MIVHTRTLCHSTQIQQNFEYLQNPALIVSRCKESACSVQFDTIIVDKNNATFYAATYEGLDIQIISKNFGIKVRKIA